MTTSLTPDPSWNVDFSLRRHLDGGSVLAGTWACDGSVLCAGSDEISHHHEVWLQRVGSHIVERSGCRVVADPVSAVLHNPGTEYRTRSVPGVPQASTVVWIRSTVLHEILEQTETDHAGGFLLPVVSVGTEAALAHFRLRMLLTQGASSPLEVEEVVFDLVAELAGVVVRGAGRPHPRRAHRDLVHAVQHVLAARFSERVLLGEIARTVGSSPFHLSRVFTSDVGLPIHRYLTRLRLYAALERMAEGEQDLSRIGLAVGFSSHSHFTTTFRREFGFAPKAIRSSGAGSVKWLLQTFSRTENL